MLEHSDKAAICKPRREADKETDPADNLSLHLFVASRIVRKQISVI